MLGGNQFKKDSSRLVWNVASTKNEDEAQRGLDENDSRAIPAVTLQPMEIRSFIVTLVQN